MPYSAVVVPRPWDESIDEHLCPEQHAHVAQLLVNDVAVITHPGAETALALDPLSAVLWASFDGRTSLRALADDLVESLDLAPDDAFRQLDGMCRFLGWRGFLTEPYVPEVLREDWFPALSDQDCPAQKMGLADAALLDLDIGPRRIRIGATDEAVVAALRAGFADRLVPADDQDEREIVCLNMGAAVSSMRPRHRLVDHWGNLLYVGRDRGVAATSLVRLVDDQVAQHAGGAWLSTPVLLLDGRAVLVHKGLLSILDQALPRLERDGVRLYESPFARLDGATGELVVTDPSIDLAASIGEPDAPVTPAGRWPIVACVLDDVPRYEAVRALSQTAVRWDQTHLDAVDALTRRAPSLGPGEDLSATAAARAFRGAFDVA